MKKINFIILIIVLSTQAWSQGRTDNWMLGYHEKYYEVERFSIMLNMETGEVDSLPGNINFESTMASISDEEGNLLMYTNGCAIYNSDHEMMKNGDGLNLGEVHELACPDYGYLLPDGAMFLPDPSNESNYYLLHLKAINDPIYRVIADQLMYSKIDVAANNNKGEVLEKNVALDNYKAESFAVIRHGNGRDWWIVVPERKTNNYHIYILDMKGIRFMQTQIIGYSYDKDKCNYTGNTVFSPDGTKLARTTAHCGMMIMDFNRCSGSLSIPIYLPEVYTDYKHIHCGFSPDSRSIYIIHAGRVEKYRLYERQLIRLDLDKLGVVRDPFYRQLLPHGVAPERIIQGKQGEMIISETNSKPYYHRINASNEKSDTIYLEPQVIKYQALNARTFSYYPNYYLGSLEESICDTITSNKVMNKQRKIRIVPNPISDYAYLHFDEEFKHIKVEIMNIEGKTIYKKIFKSVRSPLALNFTAYPSGHYIIQVKTDNKEYTFKQEKL